LNDLKYHYLKWIWRVCFAALLMATTGLGLLPVEGEVWFPGQDKVMHAATYTALYIVGWFSFPRQGFRLLFIGLLGFGIVIEVLQYFTAYRSLEFYDVVANSLGLTLGCLGIVVCRRFVPGLVLGLGGAQER